MWPNPQFSADLITFTKEILKGELHFLCSVQTCIDYESSMLQDQVDWYLYPKASIIVWNSFSFVTPFWCYMYLYVFRMK